MAVCRVRQLEDRRVRKIPAGRSVRLARAEMRVEAGSRVRVEVSSDKLAKADKPEVRKAEAAIKSPLETMAHILFRM
jgi:hypothetical protein